MVLLRHLSLVAAHHSFTFAASHRVGCDNCVADTLSHLGFQHFCNLATYAAPEAAPVPSTLLDQLPIFWFKNTNTTFWKPDSCYVSSLQLCSVSILRILLPGSSCPLRSASPTRKWRYSNVLLLIGSNLRKHQPVITDLVAVLHRSLDFRNPNSVMFWAASCLAFFRFPRASEFTVNGMFNPTSHLKFADIQVDSSVNPQSFHVFTKCSKTDPFQ